MSTTTAIKITMAYQDASERTYTINDVGTLVPTDVKTAILAFNSAASVDNSNVKKTFVSNDGAAIISITKAQIVQSTEEVIYNG